jgi:hypothetical protein
LKQQRSVKENRYQNTTISGGDANLCQCETEPRIFLEWLQRFSSALGKAYIDLWMRHLFGKHELVELLRGQIA